MSEPKPRYECPACGRTTTLWEGAMESGYYEIDECLERTSGFVGDGAWIEETGAYGCGECSWEGTKGQLVELDINGDPKPIVIRGQLDIEGGIAA